MLQRVESQARALSVRELERLHQTQQRVNEQKSKRHELVGKQLELAKERQQNDHEVAQLKLQMEILHSEEVKFVQLVEKKKKLKKMLKDAEERLKKVQEQPNVSLVTDSPIGPEDSKYRYNASSILSSLRFLLPLSHRRMGIIAELLRATEQPLPDQTPVVYIDRRISLAERLSCPRKSVFYQIFEELKGENMSFRFVSFEYL